MNIYDLRDRVKEEIDILPGAWVVFYTDLLMSSLAKTKKTDGDDLDKVYNNLSLLADCIAEWNLSIDDKELPINSESLTKLPVKLLNWLIEHSNRALTATDKKKV